MLRFRGVVFQFLGGCLCFLVCGLLAVHMFFCFRSNCFRFFVQFLVDVNSSVEQWSVRRLFISSGMCRS